MKSNIVYKSIFGGYDTLNGIPEELICPDTDYFVISDTTISLPRPWRLILVKNTSGSNVIENRRYKMMGPENIKDYKTSVYLDGNIDIKGDLSELINSLDKDKDIYAFLHPKRNNVSDELKACLIYNKITIKEYLESKNKTYKKFKEPQRELYECGILIRNPKSLPLSNSMIEWFELFQEHIHRDQIYFPFILEKHKIRAGSLGVSNIRSNSKLFSIKSHTHKTRWVDRKKVLLYKKLNKLLKWL